MTWHWEQIFGNARPVEVEIGSGTGTFLLPAATAAPGVNFFGIERSPRWATRLQAHLAARRLDTVRILVADAGCVVTNLIPPQSVQAYHVYFPDPWWKRRHHRRRLFTPSFVAALARTLTPSGRVYVATDVDDTFALICRAIDASGRFVRDLTVDRARQGMTAFERKGLARGATIHEAVFAMDAAADRRVLHASSAAPMTPAESPS